MSFPAFVVRHAALLACRAAIEPAQFPNDPAIYGPSKARAMRAQVSHSIAQGVLTAEDRRVLASIDTGAAARRAVEYLNREIAARHDEVLSAL